MATDEELLRGKWYVFGPVGDEPDDIVGICSLAPCLTPAYFVGPIGQLIIPLRTPAKWSRALAEHIVKLHNDSLEAQADEEVPDGIDDEVRHMSSPPFAPMIIRTQSIVRCDARSKAGVPFWVTRDWDRVTCEACLARRRQEVPHGDIK